MSRHSIYDATLGSLTLKQVRGTQLTANGQPINGVTSDGVLSEIFGGRKDLRSTFETDDVDGVAAVANFVTQGLAVTSGTILVPFQARQNKATFAAGESHYAVSGANGLIIPTGFSVADQGSATASLEAIFLSSDGNTAPVSELTAQSLSASSFNAMYGLGPVIITTSGPTDLVLTRPGGFSVRPGITTRVEFNGGRNYAEEVFIILPIVPTIEVTCYDLADFVGAIGGWNAITGLNCYFRKRAVAGFVADGTSEHIKFSFADGLADAGISVSGPGQDGMKTYTFYGKALTVTRATAIDTSPSS